MAREILKVLGVIIDTTHSNKCLLRSIIRDLRKSSFDKYEGRSYRVFQVNRLQALYRVESYKTKNPVFGVPSKIC